MLEMEGTAQSRSAETISIKRKQQHNSVSEKNELPIWHCSIKNQIRVEHTHLHTLPPNPPAQPHTQ